jgi:hypothetical protein
VLAPHDPRPANVVSGDRDDPPRQAGLEIATLEILPSLLRRRWACPSRNTAVRRVQRHRSMAARATAMIRTKRSGTIWHHNCFLSSARNQSRRVSGSTNEEMAR